MIVVPPFSSFVKIKCVKLLETCWYVVGTKCWPSISLLLLLLCCCYCWGVGLYCHTYFPKSPRWVLCLSGTWPLFFGGGRGALLWPSVHLLPGCWRSWGMSFLGFAVPSVSGCVWRVQWPLSSRNLEFPQPISPPASVIPAGTTPIFFVEELIDTCSCFPQSLLNMTKFRVTFFKTK